VEERRKSYKNYGQQFYDDSIDDITDEWLVMLGLYFDECLKPNKTKCSYLPFVHMHYVDVRVGFYDNIPLFEEYSSMSTPDFLNFSIDNDFINYMTMSKKYMLEVRDLAKYVDKLNEDLVDFENVFFNFPCGNKKG
jgi:hypothetical protein